VIFVDNLLLPEKGDVAAMDVHPHLGLISLVAVAESGGHEASIVDPKLLVSRKDLSYDASIYARVAELIAAEAPDVVGFTTLGCSFIFSLRVAGHLKRIRPELPILLGGPHATILHQYLLERFEEFDVVIRHEAEETLLPVLAALETRDFDGISGVSWRVGGQVNVNPGAPTIEDLDRLPMPAYESYPVEELGLESLRLDAGRGCPFHCTFCSTASFFGRSYRLKSPERLVEEFELLHARYGFTDFKLNHDLFTVNKKKVYAFCEAVKGRGYTWAVSARVDCVDEPLLRAMWDAGCRGIYFGIETGSRRMQRVSHKRLNLDLVEPILDVTEELGMRTIVSFIAGYPEEFADDQDATLDMVGDCFKRNRRLFTTQLHMLTPEPGTALHAEYREWLEYDGYLTDFNAVLLDPGDEELVRAHPDVFLTYYHYPTVLPRERTVFSIEAYRLLRRAGHTILNYALRAVEGRFSRLIGDLREWAWGSGQRDVTLELVIEYCHERFGPAHHLTSLFRYALVTEPARKTDAARLEPVVVGEFDPGRSYQLGRGTYLFMDLHDCTALIERIEADRGGRELFPDGETGPRGDYVVVARGTVDGAMDGYEVDRETLAVLSLFRRPLSYRELVQVLAELGAEAPSPDAFVRLLACGILAPAKERLAASSAAAHA
jgi:radical SAM superfamily enzyme YgiQ (UPF0313 family)